MSVIQPSRIRVEGYGWDEEEFEEIITDSLRSESNVLITDISAPPGTGKTFYTTKYAVKNRKQMIASFPTHTNQAKALEYILHHMEREHPRRLPMFVIDYGGLENYCLFMRPTALMKLLDKFKPTPDSTYEEAVRQFLSNNVITVLLMYKTHNIDELWLEIGRLLDYYKMTGNLKVYRRRIRELLDIKGQKEICKTVCPVGLMFWQYRRQVKRVLAEPKVITWRKRFAEEVREKYPHIARHIIVANPENTAENIERLLQGEFNIEWVLCPRLLLITKATKSLRGRDTFILARKTIVLTPHAGLEFVMNTVTQIHKTLKIEPRYVLFVDEYDALLKPVKFKLYSLSDLRELNNVAREILEAGLGEEIDNIIIDNYMLYYAEYIYNLTQDLLQIAENALREGVYHPLLNLFVEGATSYLKENTLRTKTEVVYKPLSPRPVHIKYFKGSDLLSRVLNPDHVFRNFKSLDPDYAVNVRVTKINFAKIATRRVKTLGLTLTSTPTYPNYLKPRTVTVERNLLNIITSLREYLMPLMLTPAFVVYYTLDKTVRLNSIDHKLFTLLRAKGIYTSATPIRWDFFVLGPSRYGFQEGVYKAIVEDGINSFLLISEARKEEYSDKLLVTYHTHTKIYTKDYVEQLENTVKQWGIVPPPQTEVREALIKQVSVRSSAMAEYSTLLVAHYVSALPSLYVPPPNPARQELEKARRLIEDSIRPYLKIIQLKVRGHKLVLTQNKLYAKILAYVLKAQKCHGTDCGSHIRKITHYNAGNIDITWFRSRAERGIDLPNDYYLVVIVGSPYPHPSYIATPDNVDTELLSTRVATQNMLYIQAYNKGVREATIAHTPRDIMGGISELAQAIGRATRSAMRHGHTVDVILPAFLQTKIILYAPDWLARL